MAYRDFKDLARIRASDIAKKSEIWWKPKWTCFNGLYLIFLYKKASGGDATLERFEILATRNKSKFITSS